MIDGHEERADLIILPSRAIANWWRHRGRELVLDVLPELHLTC